MAKQIILILLLVAYCITGQAQLNVGPEIKIRATTPSKTLFLGIGGTYSSFQDIKYSRVQYSGTGTKVEIGFNKDKGRHSWEIALNLNFSNENAGTHNSGRASVLNPVLYFKYLRPLNGNLLIGGRVDIIDFYFRKTEGLNNNSNYFLNGSYLFGSLGYNKRVNNKWKLRSSLDLGLVGYTMENTSFGFSAPQAGLEEGKFSYQNEGLGAPFGFKYFNFKYIANNINIKASLFILYRERFSVGYLWKLNYFATLKSYPVTLGVHNLIIRYNLSRK